MALTNTGFAALSGLAGNTGSITAASYLAYGDDSSTAAATHTALQGTESQREAATVSRATTTVTNDTLQLTKTFTIASTETIAEVGVLNATASGTMFARSVLSPTRSVASGDSYVCTYKIKFA